MRPVALTTARTVEEDNDMPRLEAALERAGLPFRRLCWDEPGVDWGQFALVLVRSTWDYQFRRDEFLDWADAVEAKTLLWNSAALLHWNTDKHYLLEVAQAGLPMIPTQILEPEVAPAALWKALGNREADLVLKPTVSAGAQNTTRHRGQPEAAMAEAERLLRQGRSVLVQPYQDLIDGEGETGLVYLGGRCSHAFRKAPILAEGQAHYEHALFVREGIRPTTATPEQLAVGAAALDWLERKWGHLAYARIDLVPGPVGPQIIELELTEPSLFLFCHPPAADVLAQMIGERLRA
jgi:hypothetical protein